ncbi:MAG: glycogen/starch/alpha-glucan family phosphorylase [Clostridia bacterium]|nr:glycogen/starch/alpha-glucan family phosphorylase [Clostridia bacterium]
MKWNKEEFLKEFSYLLEVEGTDETHSDIKQRYCALSKAVLADLHGDWERCKRANVKRCGYFSAEFLIGRSVFSNLLNLGVLQDVRETLSMRGIDLNELEQVEDAALGNGGLGRLAACFLESAATQNIPMDGYGLRYRYGLFKQRFENGFQKEEADDWTVWGDPWSVRRENERVKIDFADYSVYAVPYDTPVIGYKSETVNTLRLFQSEPIKEFDFELFDKMDGETIAVENFKAEQITAVLYPNDNTDEGKILRLRQQYFLVSASLQSIMREQKRQGRYVSKLYENYVLQLNDTHPTLAIPELIRLLEREGISFDEAFVICQKTFCFTNHTIMGEALEKWQGEMIEKLLPEIWSIIEKIQSRAEKDGLDKEKLYIVKDNVAHMANLAVFTAKKVNGVAELHTEILKADTFSDWYKQYPEKFVNVTNGITPRRWLLLNNPKLAGEITARIGADWEKDLPQISKMKAYIRDETFRRRFTEIKRENKRRLAAYIARKEGVILPEQFIFDVQVKRLHEYKRQLLNALSAIAVYQGLKSGEIKDFKPTAFLFGAKAAPGYYMAKAIIKFINEIAKKINADVSVADKLRVVFVQNYNVSYAEKIVCAADISEQISMAGMEASGTGNMKFMLNGTVTLGTLDGANVEICEEAGRENNYIFGATVDEVAAVKKAYAPQKLLDKNPVLKRAVETLVDGTFSDESGELKSIYDSLLVGDDADKYLVLYDFESYWQAKLRLNAEYGSEAFTTKCLENMTSAGKFSADRSVKEYAREIWEIDNK